MKTLAILMTVALLSGCNSRWNTMSPEERSYRMGRTGAMLMNWGAAGLQQQPRQVRCYSTQAGGGNYRTTCY